MPIRDEVPQNAQLTFSMHAQVPATFSGDEKIEVATVHGAYLTTLTPSNGLTLEDSQVALATLDTGKDFAPSAFELFNRRSVTTVGTFASEPVREVTSLSVSIVISTQDRPS